MLQMRARAFAARDNAADVLKGFQVREEVDDYAELRDVTPGKSDLRARLEANQGERTEGFTVENVLDDIHPVQQEKPRRTRRTRPQIELDEKVAALFDGGASDVDDIAAQTGASEADVVESLQRLGITSIIPDDGERPTAEASMDADAECHRRCEVREATADIQPQADRRTVDGPMRSANLAETRIYQRPLTAI